MEELNTRDGRVGRLLLAIAVVGTALACWRGTSDAFSVVKLTVAVCMAVALAALAAGRALHRARVELPGGAVVWALGAFLLLGLLTVVLSPSLGRSVLGQDGRSAGYLLYLSAAVVFLVAARVQGAPGARAVLTATLAGACLVALYGLGARVHPLVGAAAVLLALGAIAFFIGRPAWRFLRVPPAVVPPPLPDPAERTPRDLVRFPLHRIHPDRDHLRTPRSAARALVEQRGVIRGFAARDHDTTDVAQSFHQFHFDLAEVQKTVEPQVHGPNLRNRRAEQFQAAGVAGSAQVLRYSLPDTRKRLRPR